MTISVKPMMENPNQSIQAILRTQSLSLQIAGRTLLSNFDWEVKQGECWCIIGRNGAGKSSLLRALVGLRSHEAGDIFLHNKNINEWPLTDLAKVRSYLPQNRIDAFAFRAIETVLSARFPYQDTHYWESNQDQEIALNALKQLDVADLAQRDVRSLSGGERQRVAIAALLAQEADIMLLDEPASALDLAHQVSVMRILSQACSSQNKAVIMVSHDLNLAYRVATHSVLMLEDGSTINGTKDQVMTAEKLSHCLGHTIERFEHGEQTLFVPI
jgi:iron complex transport system ATP-binding protein